MTQVKLNKDGTVRKKPGPKKKKIDNTPKTPEAKANVAKNQFKPGQSGNKSGWNFRKPTRQFREACHTMMTEHGIAMLINLMYDAYENKKADEVLDIIKFVASYSYGNPTNMKDVDDPEPTSINSGSTLPQIVVSREAALNVVQSDEDYT